MDTEQGNSWDYSYNIYVEVPLLLQSSSFVVVHDGNARPSVYTFSGGVASSPMHHRTGEYDQNGRFVLTFADGGTWTFNSDTESADPTIRKLRAITDRNGNTVELFYDTNDNLIRVRDALQARGIDVVYDSNGRIDYIADSTGRTVSYEYYGTSDPDGNEGDLKSATRPAIDNTVTANDFPNGTTTTYTYSTGSHVAALNGNLLTIEDALQQVYLTNTYAATANPADLDFDRLVAQDWGDPGDTIQLTYASVTPGAGNNFAVLETWVNDRVGRVSQHYFNADNLEVITREYTGFANPNQPTTGSSNQPANKLRPSDPSYFETRFTYNDDAHVTEAIDPRGNRTLYVYEADIDAQADPRIRGNLRELTRQPGTACGDPTLSQFFEYEPGLGNEHGDLNFVIAHTNERGHVTEHEYDSAGNRIATLYPEPDIREDMEYDAAGRLEHHIFPEDQHQDRREIIYTYHPTGSRCPADTIVDPNGLALTTTTEYDILARVTRRIDARGNDKLYTYNEQDELVREEDELFAGVRAKTDSIYDANMRLVQVKYEALDCEGDPMPHAFISTFYEYDILGEDTLTRMEIHDQVEIVHEVQLDANRNAVLVLQGEAVNQNDANNTVTTVWDERGLVFRETRAAGTSLASTTQHDYDENGNETRVRAGVEGPERETTQEYDCHDRVVATVDPMGNRTEMDLDEVGNVEEQRLYGELVDVAGDTNNVLLERTQNVYDTMNRVTESTRLHFDPVTQNPIGGGVSVTAYTYDGESRIIIAEDANGHVTAHDFDAAGRAVVTVDPEGNIVELDYDANGNVIERTLVDRSTIDGSTQSGVWTMTYDTRNNLVETTDPMNNTRSICYDSRGRMLEEVDPKGNRVTHLYDGQGRLLKTAYELTDDGTGAGVPVGTAVVTQTWDDSNRLVAREDPNGNVTEFVYDSLDRVTKEIFANGTSRTFAYNVHDEVLEQTDPNGTLLEHTWDGLGRLTEVEVTPGVGVGGGTTTETLAHDGRSLLVSAEDDDTLVTRAWDSLGALLTETQAYTPANTSRTIAYTRDPLGNATTITYPTNRQIHRTFDGLRRTRTVTDGTTLIAELDYLGPSLLRKVYPVPQTQSDFSYDLSRRMLTSHHERVGGTVIDSREYTWDAANNKIEEDDVPTGSLTGLRTIDHDSLGRMVDSEVSGSAATNRTVDYTFDGAGNRTAVSGDTCAGTYIKTGTDADVNQYTETPCEDWAHDLAGNVVQTEATGANGRDMLLTYDHRDRLVTVEVDPGTSNEVVLTFMYDALGRKLRTRRITSSTDRSETFVFDDWNVITEYRDDTGLRFQYVYGDGLDQHLELLSSGRRFYYFEDELGSSTAMAHLSGSTLHIERYAYHDYGEPRYFFNGSQSSGPQWGNTYLFAGARWLPDASLYDLRTRHLDTLAGRFSSRDSIGIWGDAANLGNGYTYVGNSAATHTDPLGEFPKQPKFENCGPSEETQVYNAGGGTQSLAVAWISAEHLHMWMDRMWSRKWQKQKEIWNANDATPGYSNGSIGRKYFGRYRYARVHGIVGYAGRIRQRLKTHRLTIKCRSGGTKCGGGSLAWTYPSNFHAKIRLCRPQFFDPSITTGGMLPRVGMFWDTHDQVKTLIHEVAHNAGPIADFKRGGAGDVASWGRQKPWRAWLNADSYAWCAKNCFKFGCGGWL